MKFKISRLVRFFAAISPIFYFLAFGDDIYIIFLKDNGDNTLPNMLLVVLVGMLSFYCAIAFNKEEYEIQEDKVFVKSFLGGKRTINLSEIQKVELIKIWPISFIRMFYENRQKLYILPIDNPDIFINKIQEKTGATS